MPCRILRDHDGVMRGECECRVCGEKYWPVRRSHKKCYDCTDLQAGSRETPPCDKCGKHNRKAYGLENSNVCMECVSSTKEMRDKYIAGLEYNRVMKRRKWKALQNNG
jgi:hypothetical protein